MYIVFPKIAKQKYEKVPHLVSYFIKGKSFVMDYNGYTIVFFYQNINKIFSLKCDIYYAFTFQRCSSHKLVTHKNWTRRMGGGKQNIIL